MKLLILKHRDGDLMAVDTKTVKGAALLNNAADGTFVMDEDGFMLPACGFYPEGTRIYRLLSEMPVHPDNIRTVTVHEEDAPGAVYADVTASYEFRDASIGFLSRGANTYRVVFDETLADVPQSLPSGTLRGYTAYMSVTNLHLSEAVEGNWPDSGNVTVYEGHDGHRKIYVKEFLPVTAADLPAFKLYDKKRQAL